MIRKTYLFHLIQSLNRTELRYFKLLAKTVRKNSNYLKLFQEIRTQDHYDETLIKVNFKKERFIQHFHLTKRYLEQLVMKALRNYHGQRSQSLRLSNQIQNIELFYRRGLYAHAQLEVNRALKLARQYESDSRIHDLLAWQRKLIQVEHPSDFEGLRDIVKEQREVISRLNQENELWHQLLGIAPEDPPEQPTPSLQLRILKANLLYLSRVRTGAPESGEKAMVHLLTELEHHPHRLQEEPGLWAATANNLLGSLIFRKNFAEAEMLIEKAHQFYQEIDRHDEPMLKLILRTFNMELEIYRDTQNFDQADRAIARILKFLEGDQAAAVPVSYLLSFWFQFASLYFMRSQLDQALHWINQILNYNFGDTRIDLQKHSRWLNLMIHLELKNYFVLRYYVDSTRRFIDKWEKITPYETTLLQFFSRISHLPEGEFKTAFRHLQESLFTNTEIPKMELGYVNFQAWINNKLQ
ncbi:MAG: hypothetical protein DHS20C18_11400 [Saprospiraceae bacterium]|nr:MAG: hypothetical protein DHS20C18_11400 [Saprospiraceae bacterium]